MMLSETKKFIEIELNNKFFGAEVFENIKYTHIHEFGIKLPVRIDRKLKIIDKLSSNDVLFFRKWCYEMFDAQTGEVHRSSNYKRDVKFKEHEIKNSNKRKLVIEKYEGNTYLNKGLLLGCFPIMNDDNLDYINFDYKL